MTIKKVKAGFYRLLSKKERDEPARIGNKCQGRQPSLALLFGN